MHQEANILIEKLSLLPHPEGGYFKEIYRSQQSSQLGKPYNGQRSFSTSIYFLLTSDQFSAFHKISQDEIWHFYKGSPIHLHIIYPEGKYQLVKIGNNLEKGEVPQYVVPGGHWFAAEVINPNSYSLVGCTVAPGFDFLDFELAKQNDLTTICPQQKKLISQLIR